MLLDFETRSAVNLKQCGAYRYAKDPSTSILCLAWGPAGSIPEVWLPGETIPGDLEAAAHDQAVVFHAHNAVFERLIWNHVLRREVPHLPALGPARFDCTMARGAAAGWPLKLEVMGAAMGLPPEHQKDPAGNRLIQALTVSVRKTKKGLVQVPLRHDLLPALYDYCAQDHVAESAALARLPPLDARERRVWLLDQAINDRGVRIDVESARAIKTMVDGLRGEENEFVAGLTGGEVTKVSQAARLLTWVNGVMPSLGLPNMRKETVEAALLREDLLMPVREALMSRIDAGGSAVKKIESMLNAADPDDHRARGLLQYHAANTGRWGGRLVQPQNFPRPVVTDTDGKTPLVVDPEHFRPGRPGLIRMLYGSPFLAASDALRPLFVSAPGRKFVRGDLAAIEARIVLWLAGHDDAMEVFRSGACLYCETATALYGFKIIKGTHKTERQVGKIIVLGCGYQMGPSRYQEHAASNGVFVDLLTAEQHVGTYRTRWWRVPEMWKAFERAVWAACARGGIHSAHGCDFVVNNSALVCRLPSGRLLRWQHPSIEVDDDGNRSLTVLKADKGGVIRRQLYGGLITERVTQALARDVLVEAMFRAEAENLPVVLTVHDELVTEPVDNALYSAKMLEQIMSETPAFLAGCPLAAECEEGYRYGK